MVAGAEETSRARHSILTGNSLRYLVSVRPEKKFRKLISSQQSSLIKLVTILLLVIVGVGLYYLKGRILKSMLEAEENWSGWTIQLVGIQSSGTRQNFKAMNQSLIISKVWRSRRKLTRFDGARQLIVRSFFCPLMIKQ
nr:serine/threonine protein phosphatase 2A 55 kDa regulatory subunit B beta isoform-like [Ipomoea batatas]GMD37231.1 serine/threonine protein phosphatase 2A 55 kDa regulatory subunit B beta isoform-like [Ipomoea batatas]GMD38717.1 serine/threonine protein phosphatase 2A 55 kDa regulatory subunit B beta isoform-like [Ipomoea batatas]